MMVTVLNAAPRKRNGLVVMKGAQYFGGGELCVEREHCPMVNDG